VRGNQGGYFTDLIYEIFPALSESFSKETVTSTLNGGCLTLLLSLLPDLFLFLANFGSNATSLVEAENAALGFYWYCISGMLVFAMVHQTRASYACLNSLVIRYFMLVFAMVGQTVSKMALDLYQNGAVSSNGNGFERLCGTSH